MHQIIQASIQSSRMFDGYIREFAPGTILFSGATLLPFPLQQINNTAINLSSKQVVWHWFFHT